MSIPADLLNNFFHKTKTRQEEILQDAHDGFEQLQAELEKAKLARDKMGKQADEWQKIATNRLDRDGTITLEIVNGCEGDSVFISDKNGSSKRVCGPKAWGGGTVKNKWEVKISGILEAIKFTR